MSLLAVSSGSATRHPLTLLFLLDAVCHRLAVAFVLAALVALASAQDWKVDKVYTSSTCADNDQIGVSVNQNPFCTASDCAKIGQSNFAAVVRINSFGYLQC